MTRQYACLDRPSISATGLSVSRDSTLDGSSSGNCPARLSTQVMRQGVAPARALTRARPTWPAPNSTTWKSQGEITSKNRTSVISGRVDCVSTRGCNREVCGAPCADRNAAAFAVASSSRFLSPRLPVTPVSVNIIFPVSEVLLTNNAGVLFCSLAAATGTQPASPSLTTSKCRKTAPPQHCCSMEPRGNSSIKRCGSVLDGSSSRDRAMRMASYSRFPPPIVPNTCTGVTIMRAPASRGAEPAIWATVTNTQG